MVLVIRRPLSWSAYQMFAIPFGEHALHEMMVINVKDIDVNDHLKLDAEQELNLTLDQTGQPWHASARRDVTEVNNVRALVKQCLACNHTCNNK